MVQATDQFILNHPYLTSDILFSDSGGLDTIADTVRREGLAAYEAPVMEIFMALAQGSPGLVLDVGANTGLFSLAAVACNPLVKVCAFEPLESIQALLRANLALNPRLSSRVAIQPFALSNETGSVRFFEHINDQGLVATSSSLEPRDVAIQGEHVEHTIQTRTLDEWAENLGKSPITLMKVDVEGHEYAMVQGGRRTIGAHRPFLTLEVLAPAEKESLNRFLIEADYLDFVMVPGVLRQCEGIRWHPDGWNHLLCPAEKAWRILALCRRVGLRIELV